MSNTLKTFPILPSTLGLAVASLLASPLATSADSGWLIGASLGETSADLRFGSAILNTLPAGVTPGDLVYDDNDTGFKVFGGYQFNTYIALEGGRFDLGDYDFNADVSPVGTSNGLFDVDGWFLDAVGTLPLTTKLDLIGRAGFNYAYTKTNLRGTGALPAISPTIWSRDWNPKLGVGLQYALTENFDLRLESERYHLDMPVRNKDDVDLYSLGIVYRFGRSPAVSTAVVRPPAAPVERAARPAPQPSVAPTPPAPPQPTRVEFSADSLFDFDRAVIGNAGRQELDRFIANLNGTSFDNITVTGHSDRIGNRDYNLGLSQRRADAVKAYLVETGRLPAAKITARGVNGDNPRIGPNECRNTGGSVALIRCLQPDRRVVVEVNATRP